MTKPQLGLLVAYIDVALEVERLGARLTDGGDTSNYNRACRTKTDIFNRLAQSCDDGFPNAFESREIGRVGGTPASEAFGT